MSICRYDAEHGYLTREHWAACKEPNCPGCLPCEHDREGNPIRHCVAREGCTGHLAPTEHLTCARCVARTKGNLRKIKLSAAQMPAEAINHLLSHPSFTLAGPAADPRKVEARRIALRKRILGELSGDMQDRALAALPDEDEWHAYAVLGRWDMLLREDYGPKTVLRVTVDRAADYLLSIVDRLAQDDEQDFPYFAGDIARLSWYYASVLSDSRARRKGAPCWLCPDPQPALVLHYAHWCTSDECNEPHAPCAPDCAEDHGGERHDYGDFWGCPNEQGHWWTDGEYQRGVLADAAKARG